MPEDFLDDKPVIDWNAPQNARFWQESGDEPWTRVEVAKAGLWGFVGFVGGIGFWIGAMLYLN